MCGDSNQAATREQQCLDGTSTGTGVWTLTKHGIILVIWKQPVNSLTELVLQITTCTKKGKKYSDRENSTTGFGFLKQLNAGTQSDYKCDLILIVNECLEYWLFILYTLPDVADVERRRRGCSCMCVFWSIRAWWLSQPLGFLAAKENF